MNTITQLLKVKGNNVWSISPNATVFEALQKMAEKNVGAVLVMEKDNVVGIFSERDYARKVALHGKSSKEISVGELMTKDVLYLTPEDDINRCMALMTEKRLRHMPVLEKGQLLGIVSIGDVVKQVISNHEFTIAQLEKYISGSI